MKDELISFETAKLAKEKGFILGIGWFGHDDFQFYYNGTLTNNYRGDNPVACTQSLLQKWLREVHNIEIHISCVTQHNEVKKTCKLVHYQYFVKSKSQYYFIRIENEGFKTYELALEDALLESLKLIK